jgi:hypothetical protein
MMVVIVVGRAGVVVVRWVCFVFVLFFVLCRGSVGSNQSLAVVRFCRRGD